MPSPSGTIRGGEIFLADAGGRLGLEVVKVISAGGEQVDGLVLRFQGGVERVFLEEAGGKGIFDVSVFAKASVFAKVCKNPPELSAGGF